MKCLRIAALFVTSFALAGCLGDAENVSFEPPPTTPEIGPDEWPSCEQRPSGMVVKPISEVWAEAPAAPTPVWLEGVYVSGMSRGGCVQDEECMLFLQQEVSFGDLESAAGQSLRLVVSADVSDLFSEVRVGDQLDLLAAAWRPESDAEGELHLLVDTERPGCAKVRGQATLMPVEVTLAELSVHTYEQLLGPLLVTVRDVVGVPKAAYKTFSLKSQATDVAQDFNEVTSVSPFFMSGGKFSGLEIGQSHSFDSITGVFGLYMPEGGARKYEHIYVRDMSDIRY